MFRSGCSGQHNVAFPAIRESLTECMRCRRGPEAMSREKKTRGGAADGLWAEAKRKCHLNAETLRMAKELELAPKSLLKNLPHPSQPWKAPTTLTALVVGLTM